MKTTENLEPAETEPAIWRFANAEFDESAWKLQIGGTLVGLEPRPLEILLCLLRRAGETITKEELLRAVWGHSHLTDNVLSNAIGKLRRALGDDSQSIIVTVHRIGYRLAVPVLRLLPPSGLTANRGLKSGDLVPGRPLWHVTQALSLMPGREVWLAQPFEGGGAARVFKFCWDDECLPLLKREAALSQVLQMSQGARENVTRVLGSRFDQQPYFLEYDYGGLSLHEWVEQRGGLSAVPMNQRLELMALIAEAVATIHLAGVVHGNLKPTHILIHETLEGLPEIRLADFGGGVLTDAERVAEWDPRLTIDIPWPTTKSGSMLYLAPEVLLGNAPAFQSDIYALGVLLYQLVVGDLRRPLAPGWELEIGDEQLRQDIAAASNGSVERRLTSANILAERLRLIELRREQHLDEIKRRAEAHSIHRAVEQARHRRLWQIAAGIALSIGLGTSFWFVRQISLSRNEARSEVAVVRALNDFLDNDVFAGGNPNTGGSMEIAQSVALAKAAGTIDSRYAASPQIAVVLHQTLGGAYRALYQYADAESELRSARTNAYSAFGPDAELSITSDLQLAQVLVHENRYTEAQALLAQIDSLVSKRSLSDPMIPSLLLDAHTVLETHRTNRFAAASDAELERAALDDLRKQHPRTYSAAQDAVLLARLHIGTALQQADQIEQAEEYERILVTDLTDERGASDPLTIRARVRWLTCLIAMHRITEAALEIPALDRDVGARSSHEGLLDLEFMRAKAKLEAAQADWTEAIKLSEAVEAGYGRLFGANNDATILAKADTAGMLRASGQSEAAMSRYSEAYALAGTHQGESELLMQQLAYCIGASSLDAHQPMQANQYLSHLNPAALSAAAPGREWGAHFEYQHGRIALQLGRVDEAKQDFAEAIKLAQDVREASFVQRVEKALDEANALSVTAAIQGG